MITRTFYIQAGLGVRGQVKSHIKMHAYRCGVQLSIEEDKSFLSSVYYFTVFGEEDAVYDFCADVTLWCRLNAG